MQARFYHPGFGRFTAPDPARDQHFDNTQSWNIYSYVRNNPIMSVDPTGMVEKEPPPPPGSNQPRSISESMDAGGSNPGFGAQTGSTTFNLLGNAFTVTFAQNSNLSPEARANVLKVTGDAIDTINSSDNLTSADKAQLSQIKGFSITNGGTGVNLSTGVIDMNLSSKSEYKETFNRGAAWVSSVIAHESQHYSDFQNHKGAYEKNRTEVLPNSAKSIDEVRATTYQIKTGRKIGLPANQIEYLEKKLKSSNWAVTPYEQR